MKKFISMVMAAAMVVSLVPATAFADNGSAKAVAKIIDSADIKKGDGVDAMKSETTQLQLKVDGDGQYTTANPKHELTFTLDGAEIIGKTETEKTENIKAMFVNSALANGTGQKMDFASNEATISDVSKDGFKLTILKALKDKDIIALDLGKATGVKFDGISKDTAIELKSTAAGKKATISVTGDLVNTDDLVFAQVKDKGITATVKKVAEVTPEEKTTLERNLTIKADVDGFAANQVFELKLSSGFEFGKIANNAANLGVGNNGATDEWKVAKWNGTDKYIVNSDTNKESSFAGETKAYIIMSNEVDAGEINIKAADIEIVADSAKVGAECKLTVKAMANKDEASGCYNATADAVVVAKVVADAVKVSVDKDADVPVIYSGTDLKNTGLTDDSDHKALEVTVEEPIGGVLDTKKVLYMELPEGVYAVDEVTSNNEFGATNDVFKAAYKKGNYEKFEFARRVLKSTDGSDAGELKFTLKLVAEPGFTGDVKLKVSGGGMDKAQEVVIAKFVSPYTVEATKNDLIIDYRNTKVPTNIVIKEAAEGLWKKDSEFTFDIDRMENGLEDDATFTVDSKSGMEVKKITKKMGFRVDKESSDGAAEVTISDISLYMERNLPAGAYDLQLNTDATEAYMDGDVYAADTRKFNVEYYNKKAADQAFNHVVKEGFINVVTAGKDKDNTFTTKVVVPIGESKMYAGDKEIALDVPAYLSAEGYTMLPVRAVATALGVDNSSVIWNQATRTVTIMYGQRIITMVAGQKVITVNGNTIPSATTVQIKNGRTFLSLRDLGTALNVTDVTWDATTKTATLNGNQK